MSLIIHQLDTSEAKTGACIDYIALLYDDHAWAFPVGSASCGVEAVSATNSDILCVGIFLVENIFEILFREEKLSESCMTRKKKEEAPSYERYTIFNALVDAMNEKKQKKSRWIRFLNRLGVNK